MSSLPAILPSVYTFLPGTTAQPDVDTGGYDFSIGGVGFRYATDQQNPFQRVTEPTTMRRFDDSLEPGEQSLAPLPWIKSQQSFHGGAGQLHLEQGLTSFQYQQEQVNHIRYSTSLGVDVWTPGVVKRLPTTTVSAPATAPSDFVAGSSGGSDYVVAGGVGSLYRASWGSGVDAAATFTNITTAGLGGAGNINVESITTDGSTYYALIHLTADAVGAGVRTIVVSGSVSSTAAPTVMYKAASDSTQHHGVLKWAKARLIAGIDNKLYELDAAASAGAALPTAKYTHPSAGWRWSCFANSPTAILGAGQLGNQPDLLSFELDSNGAVPTLTGGSSVGPLPAGELILSMCDVLGTFLAVGTSKGVRIASYSQFNGNPAYGPLSVETTAPVYGVTTRDRFVFAGYSNQQQDGTTGLVRVDTSYVVDAAGRKAWAPDLRPPSTAATKLGTVVGVDLLQSSGRLIWFSTDGFHVEGNGPSADGTAWLQTSRIRYGTTESKLFKSARITGTLDTSSITVTAQTPFNGGYALGTFGFLVDGNPGEFNLPAPLSEWLQLTFALNGASCILSSYLVKAYPSPKTQDVITLTANCFLKETDRSGTDVSDAMLPRDRYEAVRQLKLAGQEVRFVEYTNQGALALRVLIDQVALVSENRPGLESDFGGKISLKLRVTQ